MTGKNFYSIIVPAYNCEKTIEKTYYSLINQTYNNFEVIIVNDGSKDNTLKILKQFARADKRITVLNQKFIKTGKIEGD